MSWFQNLFQRFKKDEEDEEFNGYILHKHEGLPLLNKYENLKDLDTKVSYQYPKGSYRPSYPPIPRETQKEKEETLRQKRLEKLPEKRKSREKPEIQTVKKEVPKTKKEPLPRKSGPFQPTEIPSPVFGFNRPKNTNITVEHELSHFLNEEIEKELESLVVSKETIAEPEINIPFVNEEELLEDLIEASPVSIESKEDVKEAIAVSFESTEAVDEYIAVSIEPTEEVKESIALSKEAPGEVKENIAVPIESPGEVKEYIAISIESPEAEEEEVSEAIPEPPEPKRSNLPFNVMMLKQDKQKWEERKQKRAVDQQDEVPTVNKQPEKGNQVIDLFPVKEKERTETTDEGYYTFPTDGLLNPPVTVKNDTKWLLEQEEILNETLQNFNVGASVVNVTQGPSVTRFEVQPEPGVKVNKITNLSDDIKLSLAARDIRIEAPIPGKHTIGIEVPNQKSRPVFINEIIQSSIFKESTSPLTAVLGLDIAGKPIVTDLKKMPHGLIAGATGSGKSVCINTILVSLLFKASPEDLKLLLIDPKMVELAPYNRIPHLVSPVITDVKAATAALKWAVEEMERRYELFAHTGVRDINRFNELAIKHKQYSDKLPFIVIVIDELADLMMMSPADVEEAICRIAQKARACGIHLIVATQRPSVDVITGLIKANIPTRIAFSVSSQVDSRTIIDISGAEKLLGRGDMLFLENGSSKPVRLQGTFVSDEEIDLVVGHVREQREPDYLFEQDELLKKAHVSENEDELFYEACEFIIDQGGASTSSLQRRFKIGYNRAARLMDLLETSGYITSANGSKAREVLITLADLESIQDASANN
ncbi:DNA translocase FtsK [Neobacillus drentensis]|uniref:DNA translocase FtsK n=1 Tax=Neobacillus drentensis TaxID=220684 RepID=UPI002854EE77|nr:DNA translocase FtsK [Neobacillus drentensis]MDR7239759.1 S-DNA-T family DNA segregation ATPase FtsK/SpoIIIE [Neobacillus drentensis]